MKYQHTQHSKLIFLATVVVTAIFSYIIYQINFTAEATVESPIAIYLTIAIVLFILSSFTSLTVSIDDQNLHIKFGWGLFQKKFPLNSITSAKSVTNPWYFGWGIRFWFWPRMTIYNISGYQAVEIKTQQGKTYRIGTDEPQKLESAINKSILK